MEVRQRKRFGTIAVEKRFITNAELVRAISIQTNENIEKGKHRLLGQILVDEGFLTESQVKEVLEFMNREIEYMISVGR